MTDIEKIQDKNYIAALIAKVNMNKGFTRLAAHDQELVDEMSTAIRELWDDSRKRQVIYIAVEHNIKYITNMCITSDRDRDEARADNRRLRKEQKELQGKYDDQSKS